MREPERNLGGGGSVTIVNAKIIRKRGCGRVYLASLGVPGSPRHSSGEAPGTMQFSPAHEIFWKKRNVWALIGLGPLLQNSAAKNISYPIQVFC